ncbi:hypothetical protein [Nostocoides veronense]
MSEAPRTQPREALAPRALRCALGAGQGAKFVVEALDVAVDWD